MNSMQRELPMEMTRFDHEWADVNVKEMCTLVAAAICLALTLGMAGAQMVDDSAQARSAATSSPSPVASSPGA